MSYITQFVFLVLVILECINNITCYQIADLGFTPHRLTERHTKEENFVLQASQRISVLKSQLKLLTKYVAQSKVKNKIFHNYFIAWKYAQLFHFLRKTVRQKFLPVIRDLFVNVQHPVLETSVDNIVGSYEMMLHFMAWYHPQEMMLLKPINMFKGLDTSTAKGGQLTPLQSTEIAVFDLFEGHYLAAVEWMEVATFQNSQPTFFDTPKCPLDLLTSIYSLSVQQHNRKWQEIHTKASQPDIDLELVNFFSQPMKNQELLKLHGKNIPVPLNRQTNRDTHYKMYKGDGANGQRTTIYSQFVDGCLGQRHMSLKEQATLFCYLDHTRDPYFYINPLYVEMISVKQEIYQVHKVLGSQTIQKVLHQRKMDLQRGTFSFGLNDDNFPSCLPPKHSPLQSIRIAEAITNLKFTMCTGHVTFVELPPGRMVWEHNDHTGNRSEEDRKLAGVPELGDYLATVLYYLEEPEIGGNTPVMSVGNFIPPVQGSAAVWFNMRRNGQLRIQEVEHGGCPSLHGGKVVMAHFMRYNDNWQKFKCSLNPSE